MKHNVRNFLLYPLLAIIAIEALATFIIPFPNTKYVEEDFAVKNAWILERNAFTKLFPFYEQRMFKHFKVLCSEEDGLFRAVPFSDEFACYMPYADAGEPCTDSSQCIGGCEADAKAQQVYNDSRRTIQQRESRSGPYSCPGGCTGACNKYDRLCGGDLQISNGQVGMAGCPIDFAN